MSPSAIELKNWLKLLFDEEVVEDKAPSEVQDTALPPLLKVASAAKNKSMASLHFSIRTTEIYDEEQDADDTLIIFAADPQGSPTWGIVASDTQERPSVWTGDGWSEEDEDLFEWLKFYFALVRTETAPLIVGGDQDEPVRPPNWTSVTIPGSFNYVNELWMSEGASLAITDNGINMGAASKEKLLDALVEWSIDPEFVERSNY